MKHRRGGCVLWGMKTRNEIVNVVVADAASLPRVLREANARCVDGENIRLTATMATLADCLALDLVRVDAIGRAWAKGTAWSVSPVD